MKKKYIKPEIKVISYEKLLDDKAALPSASNAENHVVDAKSMPTGYVGDWNEDDFILKSDSSKKKWDW